MLGKPSRNARYTKTYKYIAIGMCMCELYVIIVHENIYYHGNINPSLSVTLACPLVQLNISTRLVGSIEYCNCCS